MEESREVKKSRREGLEDASDAIAHGDVDLSRLEIKSGEAACVGLVDDLRALESLGLQGGQDDERQSDDGEQGVVKRSNNTVGGREKRAAACTDPNPGRTKHVDAGPRQDKAGPPQAQQAVPEGDQQAPASAVAAVPASGQQQQLPEAVIRAPILLAHTQVPGRKGAGQEGRRAEGHSRGTGSTGGRSRRTSTAAHSHRTDSGAEDGSSSGGGAEDDGAGGEEGREGLPHDDEEEGEEGGHLEGNEEEDEEGVEELGHDELQLDPMSAALGLTSSQAAASLRHGEWEQYGSAGAGEGASGAGAGAAGGAATGEESEWAQPEVEVFIGGLPGDICEEELAAALTEGTGGMPPLSIRLQMARSTGRCKGYAFANFRGMEDAQRVCASVTEVGGVRVACHVARGRLIEDLPQQPQGTVVDCMGEQLAGCDAPVARLLQVLRSHPDPEAALAAALAAVCGTKRPAPGSQPRGSTPAQEQPSQGQEQQKGGRHKQHQPQQLSRPGAAKRTALVQQGASTESGAAATPQGQEGQQQGPGVQASKRPPSSTRAPLGIGLPFSGPAAGGVAAASGEDTAGTSAGAKPVGSLTPQPGSVAAAGGQQQRSSGCAPKFVYTQILQPGGSAQQDVVMAGEAGGGQGGGAPGAAEQAAHVQAHGHSHSHSQGHSQGLGLSMGPIGRPPSTAGRHGSHGRVKGGASSTGAGAGAAGASLQPPPPPVPDMNNYLDLYPNCRGLLNTIRSLPNNGTKTPISLVNEYASRLMLDVVFCNEVAETAAGPYSVSCQLQKKVSKDVDAEGRGRGRNKRDARQVAAAACLEWMLTDGGLTVMDFLAPPKQPGSSYLARQNALKPGLGFGSGSAGPSSSYGGSYSQMLKKRRDEEPPGGLGSRGGMGMGLGGGGIYGGSASVLGGSSGGGRYGSGLPPAAAAGRGVSFTRAQLASSMPESYYRKEPEIVYPPPRPEDDGRPLQHQHTQSQQAPISLKAFQPQHASILAAGAAAEAAAQASGARMGGAGSSGGNGGTWGMGRLAAGLPQLAPPASASTSSAHAHSHSSMAPGGTSQKRDYKTAMDSQQQQQHLMGQHHHQHGLAGLPGAAGVIGQGLRLSGGEPGQEQHGRPQQAPLFVGLGQAGVRLQGAHEVLPPPPAQMGGMGAPGTGHAPTHSHQMQVAAAAVHYTQHQHQPQAHHYLQQQQQQPVSQQQPMTQHQLQQAHADYYAQYMQQQQQQQQYDPQLAGQYAQAQQASEYQQQQQQQQYQQGGVAAQYTWDGSGYTQQAYQQAVGAGAPQPQLQAQAVQQGSYSYAPGAALQAYAAQPGVPSGAWSPWGASGQ